MREVGYSRAPFKPLWLASLVVSPAVRRGYDSLGLKLRIGMPGCQSQ